MTSPWFLRLIAAVVSFVLSALIFLYNLKHFHDSFNIVMFVGLVFAIVGLMLAFTLLPGFDKLINDQSNDRERPTGR